MAGQSTPQPAETTDATAPQPAAQTTVAPEPAPDGGLSRAEVIRMAMDAADNGSAEGQPSTADAQDAPPKADTEKTDDPPKGAEPSRADYWRAVAERDKATRDAKAANDQFAKLQQLAKQDPLQLVQGLGLSLDTVLDALSGAPTKQDDDSGDSDVAKLPAEYRKLAEDNARMTQRLERLERGVSERDRSAMTARSAARIRDMAQASGARLIVETGSEAEVLQLAIQAAEQAGWSPEIAAARSDELLALAIEHHERDLADRAKADYDRLARILGLSAPAPAPQATSPAPVAPVPSLGGSSPETPAPRAAEDYSREEVLRLAMQQRR